MRMFGTMLASALISASAFARTTGDGWDKAASLTAKTAAQSNTVTCVNKYDANNDGNATGEPVYYFKIRLTKGTPLKVWIDSTDEVTGIDAVLAGDDPDYHFEAVDDFTLVMRSSIGADAAGCWSEDDPEELNFYFMVHGDGYWDADYTDNGDFKSWRKWDADEIGHGIPKVTFHWQQIDYVEPIGSQENPERITDMATTLHTLTCTAPYADEGYYFIVNLTAGENYLFQTTGGTVESIEYMSQLSGISTVDPTHYDYETDGNNNGYIVTPSETGDYSFSVESGSGSVSISYKSGVVRGRLPVEHECIQLGTPDGTPVEFTPGHITEPGSQYHDDVIDQCLFSFKATAGSTYRFATTGAKTNLLMRLYDASGAILAEDTGRIPTDSNTLLIRSFADEGTYYIGVCENLDDDAHDTPSGQPISLVVDDITGAPGLHDAWDPGDDTAENATPIAISNIPAQLSRTMWAASEFGEADTNDWFRFEAVEGVYYNFSLDSWTPASAESPHQAPGFYLYDDEGVPLEASFNGFLSWGAKESGTVYLKVAADDCCGHNLEEAACDCAYKFTMRSVDVGTVGFADESIVFADGTSYAELRLRRTSGDSSTAVDWMTGAIDAVPGTDYCAASGRVEWAVGDVSEKVIRVKLIPSLGRNYVSPRSFMIKAVGTPESELSGAVLDTYYPAVVTMPGTALVTISGRGDATGAGTVGFCAYGDAKTPFGDIAMPEITVAPGTPVKLWVCREGGSDGEASMEFSTASPGFDGDIAETDTGNIVWEDGECGDKSVGILIANFEGSGVVDVQARLRPTARNLGLDAPYLGSTLAIIHVNTALEPYSQQQRNPQNLALAKGVFLGVLDSVSGIPPVPSARLAKVSLSAESNGLYAAVNIGGSEYAFRSSGYMERGDVCIGVLSCESVTIGGKTGSATLEVRIGNLDAASLDCNAYADTATLNITLPSDSFSLSGAIFRDNSAEIAVSPILASVAGRYNIALVSPFDDCMDGIATLQMNIGTNGVALVSGLLGDGTPFSASSLANVVGSTLFASQCNVAVPVYSEVGGTVIGGTLMLAASGQNGPLVACGTEMLHTGSASTESILMPTGGEYSTNTVLQAKITGCALSASDGSLLSDVEICGDMLVPADTSLALTFNASTGAFEGTWGGRVISGVFTGERGESAEDGIVAFGRIAKSGGGTTAFTLSRGTPYSTDENWELDICLSFYGNGNTCGDVPEAMSDLAPWDEVILPAPEEEFANGSLVFIGWSDGNSLYMPGDSYIMGIADVIMTAVWSAPTIGFADAVGAPPEVVFMSGESEPWVVDGERLKSGAIGANASSELSAIVRGKGLLKFDWMTSCDTQPYAGAIFYVNGEEIARLDGSVTWSTQYVDIHGGETVMWKFWKASGALVSGFDAAFLANVSIFGGEAKQRARITLNARGGDLGSSDSFIMAYVGDEYGELPVPVWNGYGCSFEGWFDEDGNMITALSTITSADVHLSASWKCAVAFDGNGNTGGTVPNTVYGESGDIVILPGAGSLTKGEGYVLAFWSDGTSLYEPETEYTIPESSIILTAIWNRTDIGAVLGSGAAAFAFDTSGSSEWFVTDANASEGATSMRSGDISAGKETILTATALSAGTLSFDWAASCDEIGYAWCAFTVNGDEIGRIGGETYWTTVEVDIAAGDILSWTYAKNAQAYDIGQDCAWVDNFRFGKKATVRFLAEDGDPAETNIVAFAGAPIGELPEPTWANFSLDHWAVSTTDGEAVNEEWIVPEEGATLVAVRKAKEWNVSYDLAGGEAVTVTNESYTAGASFALPGADSATKDGYALAGWTDGNKTYDSGATFTVPGGSDVTLVAVWSLDIGESVLGPGAAAFAFDTSGAAEWFVTSDKAYDAGGMSMRSGPIGKGAESVLTATATSSGTLSFQWAASCDDIRFAWCAFAVNGVEMGRIGNVTDWTAVEIDVAAGDRLTWIYTKSNQAYGIGDFGYTAQDCVWVDALSFGKKTTVTFEADGGDPATTNVVAFAGEPIGELPEPTWPNFSLDHWADPTGGVVTAEWIVPEEAVTLTAVTKAKEWRVMYDLAGGTAVTVTNESYVAGTTFVLPGEDSATKDGLVLTGWTDGSTAYAPGESFTVQGGSDLAFTAVWQQDYASALDCSGKGIKFASGGNAEWSVQSDKAKVGVTALRSGGIGGNGEMASSACSSWIEATVVGSGSLSFDWAVSCDDGYNGELFAWAECTLNGETARGTGKIYGTKDASWRSVTLTLPEGTNLVRWTFAKKAQAYNESSNQAGQDRAWLDNLAWTPDKLPEYEFTVNWAADASVLGARYSIEDGDQNVEAVNGEAIAVPDGKKITVVGFADTNNWYYITGGTGTWSIAASTIVTAAKRDEATPATAEDVGLSGAFADADVNVVSNVMSWAQANDKTVADVNAMTFGASGDPVGVDAEAYLLNCAPADVATEAAKFKVTSFSVDASGNISITPADGDAYGNGSVEVRYSSTLGGEYTTTKPVGNQCFIKVFLVR